MKLVIAGTMPPAIILDKLSSYKYREDVVLVPMPDDGQWHALLAAAYALVYLPAYTHAAPVANAMQAQVPVIIHDNQANHAIWGDAVLYSKPEDTAHLSQQLIHLYKNESSRSNMIARAAALQQANSFNTMLHQLCTSLQQLAKPH
jgi:glycosyltransferase involved in cell wall biosynthesis